MHSLAFFQWRATLDFMTASDKAELRDIYEDRQAFMLKVIDKVSELLGAGALKDKSPVYPSMQNAL